MDLDSGKARQLPVVLYEDVLDDAAAAWNASHVVDALVQQRSLDVGIAQKISKEVEAILGKKKPQELTRRDIVSALDAQLIKHGFERDIELSDNALRVLEKRYLRRNEEGKPIERPKDMFARVARAIAAGDRLTDPQADIEKTALSFYEMMTSLEFLPNSPTLMNAGRHLGQLSACFVLPVDDSMESIFEAVKNTALIHKSGGGTGFSFSRIRPSNDVVHSTKGVSSGPVSFMRVFDAATETIKQGGTRRGANMGILRVDHPDILDFISCKTDERALNNFNISVGITAVFMEAVEQGTHYELINPRGGKVARTLDARKVFDTIVRLAWRNGEPGIIYLDRLNKDNPTPHIGTIESTNPCGEQPLLPYESCNLGSINLARMVRDGEVDWERLRATVRAAVHFLDNVIDVNRYPLEEIAQTTRANRKIGLGVMGYADMLIALGLPYNSEDGLKKGTEVMAFIQHEARGASADLAEKRGAFPNFKGSIYDKPRKRPVRNATCTTIAPTGTLSIIAGCSSGIELLYAICFGRHVLDNEVLVEVQPTFALVAQAEGFYTPALLRRIAEEGTIAGFAEIPEPIRRAFVTAHDISPEWHVRTQAGFQQYTDNAVSKTVNLRNGATEEEVAEVYRLSYMLGCKGVTVYRDGSRSEQVLQTENRQKKNAENAAVQDGGLEGSGAKISPRERPSVIQGCTQKMSTGCGNLYVTINADDHGIFELFTAMGKAGGCASSQAEAISRLISLSLRAGVGSAAVIKQLSGVRCPSPAWKDGEMVLSCADAIARAIKQYERFVQERDAARSQKASADCSSASPAQSAAEPEAKAAAPRTGPASGASMVTCPDCGGTVDHVEGCMLCRDCGFSRCT